MEGKTEEVGQKEEEREEEKIQDQIPQPEMTEEATVEEVQ